MIKNFGVSESLPNWRPPLAAWTDRSGGKRGSPLSTNLMMKKTLSWNRWDARHIEVTAPDCLETSSGFFLGTTPELA
ncbi:MAG: hypothetical protein C0P72_010680 [Clostridia bacterium]|jgi:hypothetical protein